MPTSTFLNLPAEKQERLMDAATREFSARPHNEASLNQIIQDAGIPRRSLYMYFQDKEDLFRYLFRGYMDQLMMVLEEALLREKGDIFAALLRLFDYTREKRKDRSLGGMGAMAAIIGRNSGMQKNVLLGMVDTGRVLDRLRQSVDPELLDLRQEQDLTLILAVLLSLTGPLVYSGIQEEEAGTSRERLASLLDVLRRGMAKDKGPRAEEH